MSRLKIRLFGPFQVWLVDEAIARFRSDKIRALLAYLAVEVDLIHDREALATLLWSEKPNGVARTNLRNSLARLRQALASIEASGDGALFQTTRQTIQLTPNRNDHWIDVLAFSEYLTTCQTHPHSSLLQCPDCIQSLTKAAAIYRGDFLSGLALSDSPLFEEWRLSQQENFHRQALLTLDTLVAHYVGSRNYQLAERYIRRQLSLEPWLETAHQQLMRVLALQDRRTAALAQYEICQQALAKELEVLPNEATQYLYSQIRDGVVPEVLLGPENNSFITSPTQLRPILHNLPQEMTPFFGREAELVELKQLIEDVAYRLITLVGGGGVGKTRLALTVAKQLLSYFADGVWFVDLAGVNVDRSAGDPKDVTNAVENTIATAIAEAFNFQFYESDTPKAQIVANLRHKNVLLILDNFEHLLRGADVILDLLSQVPALSVLITSREQLGFQAEYIFQLEGLPVPSLTKIVDAPTYSSVKLFAERADRTRSGFRLDDHTLPEVVQICDFLEGLPLGIELAASWISRMTCVDIAQAMAQNLDFLTTSTRDVPVRHRSLRAVFEYSWQMLSDQEKLILSQASIFKGEFSQDAAINVISATPIVLTSLVDKSLVQSVKPGRYQLHELLRQFAAEKLLDLVEDPETRQSVSQAEAQHAQYYLAFLQHREVALHQSDTRTTLSEIKDEINNIRQAWQWAVTHLELDQLQQSLEALSQFYYLTGLFEEGVDAFESMSGRINSLDTSLTKLDPVQQQLLGNLRIKQAMFLLDLTKTEQAIVAAQSVLELGKRINSKMFIAAGYLWWGRALWYQGRFDSARSHLEKSLSLAQSHLPQIEAHALRSLSNLDFDQGDYAQAYMYLRQTLAIYQDLANIYEEAATLSNLGLVTVNLGDYQQAQDYIERSLQIRQKIGDRQGEAISLEALGNMYYRMEQFGLAQSHLETALKIYEQIRDQEGIGYTLTGLGNVWMGLGKLDPAKAAYQQALQVRQGSGQRHLLSEDRAGLAQVALAQGNLAQAQVQVALILNDLAQDKPKGEDIFRIYLACYQVLQRNHDPRAYDILQTAYQHLQAQADKLENRQLRQSLLQNVPTHRQVIQAWRLVNEGG